MKKIILILCLAAIATAAWADAPVKREHRAVWMSAYVNDWPSGAITASNEAVMRTSCNKMLDTLRANNMNVVYYHVRAMADAMYNSQYEPWSSYVSGTRGVAPAFDPLDHIVTQAHKRGLEIYAWVNPYRYAPKNNMWGQSELDYVHTHPEWLLTTDYETVLNPGIPEVRQRVVDVCRDIIEKYDVDGIVFDDYFYPQGGTPLDADSALYNAYVRQGGTLAQADWRRENVNMMVRDVNNMIKSTKPWVRFGIGPAGVACGSADVAAKYGVDPCPGNDWQYGQIHSDPMAWLTRGTIDFMSPQVYRSLTQSFEPITRWWGRMGDRFNRHVYISQTVNSTASTGWELPDYLQQVRIIRDASTDGNPGLVFFKYSTWRQLNGRIDGHVKGLRIYLRDSVYNTVALSPAVTWVRPDKTYTTVTDVTLTDGTLTWQPEDNVRYVVYAYPDTVPDAQFLCQAQYIAGIAYDPTFTLPENRLNGYKYAVTILDRLENEYAPVTVGATPSAAPMPQLVAPADGATVSLLDKLQWQSPLPMHTVQIFTDPEMTDMVANFAVDSLSVPLDRVPGIGLGTYYWRVVGRGLNQYDTASELHAFTVEEFRVTSPQNNAVDVSLTPTIAWNCDQPDVPCVVEIATTSAMNNIVRTDTVTGAAHIDVPHYALSGARDYYVRVSALRGATSVTTPVSHFRTVEVIPPVPTIIYPEHDGTTLYPTSQIKVAPVEGITSLRLEVSAKETFPARSSYRGTISNWSFCSPVLDDMGTVTFKDGNTYYVRARFAHYTLATGTTTQYTDYSPVLSFIYRESLNGDVNGDGELSIADVTALVDLVMREADNERSDVNGDGETSVADITSLVMLLMGL